MSMRLWLLAVLYLIAGGIYLVMLTVTIPHLRESSGGLRLPDLAPTGLDRAQTLELLTALGDEGRSYYMNVQLPLDTVYPAAMGMALGLSLATLARRNGWAARHRVVSTASVLIPVAGALCDWGENACTFLMLRAFPDLPEALPRIGAVSSTAKSVLVPTAVLLLAVSCVQSLRRRRAQ